MRRRSGALHCESQQDFMQLAEAAHNQIGIFYDQKMNKKIMHQFKAIHQTQNQPFQCHISNPEHSAEKTKQDYSGFQFGLETDREKQERQQLQRPNLGLQQSQNIAIISDKVPYIFEKLANQNVKDTTTENRNIELIIQKVDNKIIKYWLFSKQYVSNEGPLVSLYMQYCQVILQISPKLKVTKNYSYQQDSSILSRLGKRLE